MGEEWRSELVNQGKRTQSSAGELLQQTNEEDERRKELSGRAHRSKERRARGLWPGAGRIGEKSDQNERLLSRPKILNFEMWLKFTKF
jgi:hypothetical protein